VHAAARVEQWVGLPPLTRSAVLDPWRVRHRLDLLGQLETEPPHGPTRSEMMLWEALDADGQGWLREHVTGPYRLDFYLPSVRLAVEVDGASHRGRVRFEKDALRDAWHAGRGITTRRFSADEVERDLPWVLDEVRRQVTTLAAPSPAGPNRDDMQQEQVDRPVPAQRAAACTTVLPDLPSAVRRRRYLL